SGMWDVGITQAGSRVAGLSSSGIGFNHSGLVLICGRCAELVSSESDILAVSGIEAMMSLKCQSHVFSSYMDQNLVEEEEDLNQHVISYETYLVQQRFVPLCPFHRCLKSFIECDMFWNSKVKTVDPRFQVVLSRFLLFCSKASNFYSSAVTRANNSKSVVLCCCGGGGSGRVVVVVDVVVVKIGT
ncbi:hypothetical protein Tco_1305887, partial [Tanacetum coccineum]